MTNQEYMAKLNPEELYLVMDVIILTHTAIEWLKKEYDGED